MRKIRRLLILGLLSLCSCNSGPPPLSDGAVEIDETANGTAIQLAPGASLRLKLPGNATTGYEWQLKEMDGRVLENTGHNYQPQEPVIPGSPGTDLWLFRARGGGNTALRLEYRRAWETAPPASTFQISVAVSGAAAAEK